MKQKKQKTNPASRAFAPIRWEFESDIPTCDFFEEGPLDETWNLQEAVARFIFWLEEDRFLTWEAVVCQEQGVALAPNQKKLLGDLLDFNDEGDDQILYIDEIPRPSEPWHIILSKIVPYLLIEPFRTFDCQDEVKCEGWNQIMGALQEHGKGLSLPPGVEQIETVIPAELRHKLWLQFCFGDLSGLGQEENVPLDDPEQHYRIEWFIDHLRQLKESVAYFGLTLDSLLTMVFLPDRDRAIFVNMMQENLGLSSVHERIGDHL